MSEQFFFSYRILIPLALFLGFAPFVPRPHIAEKLQMLCNGTLKRLLIAGRMR